jgi:hypothetical protein
MHKGVPSQGVNSCANGCVSKEAWVARGDSAEGQTLHMNKGLN